MTMETKHPAGIYIHTPFCLRKCRYCDFYSITDLSLIPEFVSALLKEMDLRADLSRQYDSLYFGGGTPSVLSCDQIQKFLEKSLQCFDFQDGAEVTIEVNPGTVNFRELKQIQEMKIDRISIGVQSFQDKQLAFLGRIHTASQGIRTIASAREAGFDNLSIDLIYGLPGQTEEAWLSDLKQALEFEPEHLSCYMLTYEDGTPMQRDLAEGRFEPLSDKAGADFFNLTLMFLKDNGYIHYEVSNFAGAENLSSRHNRKYWSLSPYVGLGPAAHSYEAARRTWNHRSVHKYITELGKGRLPIEDIEHLTKEQQMMESIYLGLRQTRGIHIIDFNEKYRVRFNEKFKYPISVLQEKNCLEISDGHCFLTSKGMRYLDSITSMFTHHI